MSLKNIIRKSVASLGAIALLSSHCSLCGIGLIEVIAENASVPQIAIEWSNEEYVQYLYTDVVEVEGQQVEKETKGVAVESKLSVYPIYGQDTYLPTERVEINVGLPSINGYLPERSIVADASTKSTTGKENDTSVNQNYDSNSGLLTVSYENTPDENKNIYSIHNQNAKDEFEIIYIYPAEAYSGNDEEIKIQSLVNARMTFKTENGNMISENIQTFEMTEKNNKGDILTFGVTGLKNNIYKGFMYSNVQNKTSYDTEYNTVSTFAVLNANVVDTVSMELKESEFILNNEEQTRISTNGNIVYKSTQISRAEFDKIVGQDEALEIYTGTTQLATVRYIEVSENEQIVKKLAVIYANGEMKILSNEDTTILVEYAQNVSSLKINITKPVAEGFMHFENKNVIKATSDYGCSIKDIKYITTQGVVNEKKNDVKIELLEPETKVSVVASNTNFSTLQNNKTTLTITLDDTNASAKLFDAPIINVKLPDGIVAGNLSSPEIVNGNGLYIKNTSSKNNVITIELEGKQTTYDLTNVSGGVKIVMDIENIDYADTLPTHEDNIEVTCIQGEEEKVASCNVKIVSKVGLLLLSNISGFDNSNTVLQLMNNDFKTIEIEKDAEKKQIVQTFNLVNNYDESMTNVKIVGKIGYSNNEVTSTFLNQLSKSIETTNGKVYYSNNVNATWDDDSWTEEFITDAKAYKIELENNELHSGTTLEAKLNINIPANLGYNQENYLNLNVEYNYKDINEQENITIGFITEKDELVANYNVINQEIMTSSGEEVPISISVNPSITQNYVHGGQLVTYKINVRNDGQENLNNLVLTSNISDNAIYTYYQQIDELTGSYLKLVKDNSIKQKEWQIESLKPGERLELEMMLTMADVTEEQEVVNSIAIIYNGQTLSTENKVLLKPAKIHTTLTTAEENMINIKYRQGDIVNYYIKVENITDKKLNNVKVQYNLPEDLEYVKGGSTIYDEFIGYQIVEEGNFNEGLFEYNIERLEAGEVKIIQLTTKVKQLTQEYNKALNNIAKIYVEDSIYETNVKTIDIEQLAFEFSLSVDSKGKEILKENDEVTYIIKAKNIGEALGLINISDNIPSELKVLNLEYYINQEEPTVLEYVNQNITFSEILNEGDLLTFKIFTKVRNTDSLEEKIIEVVNQANLRTGNMEISSNEVSINIKLEIAEEDDKYEDGKHYEDGEEDEFIGEPEDKIEEDITGGVEDDNIGKNDKLEDYENNKDYNNDGREDEGNVDDNEDEENGNTGNEDGNEDEGNGNTGNEDDNEDEGNGNTGNEDDNEGEGSDNSTKVYSISGIAWIDTNRNGQKDTDEVLQHSVVVSLVDMATGNFALNSDGNRITATTNNQGQYTFSNIPGGKYIILFEFDTNTYAVTTYKKENVSEELNSDAILTKVTVNGEQKLAGVTDNIELNSNKQNLDIGLIQNATFDLSLDKQITKITIVNSKGTESYEYKDGDTAKVDLVAKYMNGANVIVTYKFTITNEGDVSGYVNSLVDNLPSGLEFSSELNKDWYKGSDGRLYTTSLSAIEIKPGESKQVELVLTKNMTEDNAGIFPNSAKLEKISNLQNIQEKEDALENNQSSATLIISIKTGTIAMYIGITTICLVIIGIGTYFIKKKVLNRGI